MFALLIALCCELMFAFYCIVLRANVCFLIALCCELMFAFLIALCCELMFAF